MQASLCSRQRSPSFAGQCYAPVAQQLSAKEGGFWPGLAACKTLANMAGLGGPQSAVQAAQALDRRSRQPYSSQRTAAAAVQAAQAPHRKAALPTWVRIVTGCGPKRRPRSRRRRHGSDQSSGISRSYVISAHPSARMSWTTARSARRDLACSGPAGAHWRRSEASSGSRNRRRSRPQETVGRFRRS